MFFSVFILVFALVLGTVFFFRAQMHMEEQLKDSLKMSVSMAAEQFNAEDITRIGDRESMTDPVFEKIVDSLYRLRAAAPNIRFAYILRKTEDPQMLEFVADADSLTSDEELDVNDDGTVDADENVASFPGDPYDLLQAPAMIEGFDGPATDHTIVRDKWSASMSGYAPIRNADGEAVAILGIDMDAADFVRLSQSVFSPVAYLTFLVTVILLVLYILAFLWQRRIESLKRIEEERSGVMLLTFHQLGTPLTIIRWSLEALKEALTEHAKLEPAVLEHTKNMETATGQLTRILSTLKEASLVEEGTIVYKTEPVALRSLVDQIVTDLYSSFERRKQRIELHIDPTLTLPLDRDRIGGVIRELLTNASDFSPDHTAVSIRVIRNKEHIEVQISDHGYGIRREDQPRLFSKYMRGHDAHRYRPEGNGMGLFVARGIVRRAGGDMWIESTEGIGTRVTFTLPFSSSAS